LLEKEMTNQPSEAETRTIASLLRPRSSGLERATIYGAYVLPSAIFASYSIWRRDFVAALVAYVALLMVVLLYLRWAHDASGRLRSAVDKIYTDHSRSP
jgi:hypothetical protein